MAKKDKAEKKSKKGKKEVVVNEPVEKKEKKGKKKEKEVVETPPKVEKKKGKKEKVETPPEPKKEKKKKDKKEEVKKEGKKDKKGKKKLDAGKALNPDEELKDRIIILDCEPEKQLAEMLIYSDSMKPVTSQDFKTTAGTVTINKGEKRTTFALEGKSIPKTTIQAMLRPKNDKEPKSEKKKAKNNEKQAKDELLLTLKQLEGKHKVRNFLDALDFMQLGKGKQRKAVAKAVDGIKKLTGNNIVEHMKNTYGNDIATHTLFKLFENIESAGNLAE